MKARTWLPPTVSGLVRSWGISSPGRPRSVHPHSLLHPAWGAPQKGAPSRTQQEGNPQTQGDPLSTRELGPAHTKPATDLLLASAALRPSWPPSGESCQRSPPTDLREGERKHRNESGSWRKNLYNAVGLGDLDSQAVTTPGVLSSWRGATRSSNTSLSALMNHCRGQIALTYAVNQSLRNLLQSREIKATQESGQYGQMTL